MPRKCLVEKVEHRELDSYDLITVLGLLKEHDWHQVWRRYSPGGAPGRIDLRLSTDHFFLDMCVQSLPSLALSAKYLASPHMMQALIRRILCDHRHSLILQKMRNYDFPISDENQLDLSCSMGTISVDLMVIRNSTALEEIPKKYGNSRVEQEEQRPLDHYDLVSILYLAQQNLTNRIIERYVPVEVLEKGAEDELIVRFPSLAGNYLVEFFFKRIKNDQPCQIPPRGNVSTATMHQVVRRIFAGHNPELVSRELTDKGILIDHEEVQQEFTLARILNDNYIELKFKHL